MRKQLRRVVRLVTGPAGAGPAVALAVIAAIAAFLATAGPREAATLQNRALRQTMATAQGFGLFASAEWSLTGTAPRQLLTAGQLQTIAGVIGSYIGAPLVPVPPSQRWSQVTTRLQIVGNPAAHAVLVFPPQLEVAYRSNLASNAALVSGAYPGAATITHRAGKTVVTLGVAVTQATASRFRLRPGSKVTLESAGTVPGPSIVLNVTGVVRPADPAAEFWTFDPTITGPTVNQNFWVAGALISASELSVLPVAYPLQNLQVAWGLPVRTSGLTVAELPAAINALTSVSAGDVGGLALKEAKAPLQAPPTVSPAGLNLLQAFQAGQNSVNAVDSLLTDGLFAVALILLLACALVVADAYEAEVSLTLARGGSTQQAALRILGRTAVAAGPAIVIGVAAGVAATPRSGTGISGSLVGIVVVTTLAAPPLLCAWRHRGSRPLAEAGRTDLVIPRRSMRRVVAEATVLLAIVGAVVALRQRGASPGTSNDPYVGTAPVLVAVAAGLIAARLYPWPLRGLLRLAAPRRSAVGFLGIARAARSRPGVLLPALALVVALAVIALGGTLRAAVTRGQVAASWQQVGADAVIRTTGSQQVVPPAAEKAVASVPGVTHADAVFVVAPHDPLAANLGPGFGGTSIGVVVVNPASYAALAAATPYPAFPARLLAKTGSGPVPVLASPQVAAVLKHETGHLAFASSVISVRLAAPIARTPALPGGGPFVIVPSWAQGLLRAGVPPNIVLATGASINFHDLAKVLRQTMPRSQVTSRQAALAAIAHSPSVHGADVAFELCVAAAVAVSTAAVLLGLLLSGRDRTRMAAWLTALGMTSRQARRLAVLDALPLVLIAVVGAMLAGSVLAQIVAPAIDLSVFTGSTAAVPVTPDLVALTAPAAGAVVLVAVITAVQSALTRRRTTTGVLRLDEGR
jgi:putative ABC transport system permease protein